MKVKLAKALDECAQEGARKLAMGEPLPLEWISTAIDLLHRGSESLNPTNPKSSGPSSEPFVIGTGRAGGLTVNNK